MTAGENNQYWVNRKKLYRVEGRIAAFTRVLVDTQKQINLANNSRARLLRAMNKFEKKTGMTLS